MASVILQIMAFVVVIGGGIAGLIQMGSGRYDNQGLVIIVASVVSGALLFGIGNSFDQLQRIADDTKRNADAAERSLLANERTAEALERLVVQRRREQPQNTQSPPNVIKPIS